MRSLTATTCVPLGLLVLASGCMIGAGGERTRAMDELEFRPEDYQLTETRFFKLKRVSLRFHRLPRHEREDLIKFQIEILRTPMWYEARTRLIQMGRETIPFLIEALDRREEAASSLRPRPGPKQATRTMFNTLGDVAWLVLREMIGEYSNYRRSFRLPERDKDAWLKWWSRHRGGLVINSRARRPRRRTH